MHCILYPFMLRSTGKRLHLFFELSVKSTNSPWHFISSTAICSDLASLKMGKFWSSPHHFLFRIIPTTVSLSVSWPTSNSDLLGLNHCKLVSHHTFLNQRFYEQVKQFRYTHNMSRKEIQHPNSCIGILILFFQSHWHLDLGIRLDVFFSWSKGCKLLQSYR